MQIHYFDTFGGLVQFLTYKGNTLTGPLYLVRDPEELLEAASKNYVDTLFTNLHTSFITSGILHQARLPAFSGDFTSVQGTNQVFLTDRGYNSDPRTRYTVDEKGIVVGIENLSNSDLPNFDFSKVMFDKPTSAAGWGITDALDVSGGSVVDNLTMYRSPEIANEVAVKSYVDGLASSNNATAETGDLIFKRTEFPPVGYLRCNGAAVSTTTYGDLFSVIGHIASDPGGGMFYLPELSNQSFAGYNYFVKT